MRNDLAAYADVCYFNNDGVIFSICSLFAERVGIELLILNLIRIVRLVKR
jgi:hypothetical protein